eukprot:TRINITY_DN6805_c0_g1_i1.p1 TRINITY_DN6805_c0_g1~~TRINITY_DN6805_c0_g1_i1.p1  ORF type:complete len:540 (+),score=92.90 TRINITY_DN6805_c0_g1_i1:15-1634(+)
MFGLLGKFVKRIKNIKPKIKTTRNIGTITKISAGISVFGVAVYAQFHTEEATLKNWSSTHEVETKNLFRPSSQNELEQLVVYCQDEGKKIRPLGSGLSPNAIAFASEGMVNMSLLDRVVNVDKEKKQITVEAGARVSQVVEALRPYNLTLQNYASIAEQQIGGFIQVGAHGTGATVPPVEEQVVSFKIVTPGKGVLKISRESNEYLFNMLRVGLGAFGIISEVTLQCVDAHKLVEKTYISTREEVKKNHIKNLKENRHLRYMWIPYTDAVVVVSCNYEKDSHIPHSDIHEFTEDEKLIQTRNLLKRNSHLTVDDIHKLSFTGLRDELIASNPLDTDHIIQVNEAEKDFWSKNQGYRVDFSDKILGFDCGGEQWVTEVAFPIGHLSNTNGNDIKYMEELLSLIESNKIPAPSPIEQRWTSNSTAIFSPSHDMNNDNESVFSWVGIIMYLPLDNPHLRDDITKRFYEYTNMCRVNLWEKYKCRQHWAKLELNDSAVRQATKQQLSSLYPVDDFCKLRKEFDPKNVLGNEMIDFLFPTTSDK